MEYTTHHYYLDIRFKWQEFKLMAEPADHAKEVVKKAAQQEVAKDNY